MIRVLLIFLFVALAPATADSQPPTSFSPGDAHATGPDADQKASLLRGERWRRLMRSFDEWLSVQTIYTTAEVAAMKADLQARVAAMSGVELEDFVADMEERLNILLSDEAADARAHLSIFSEQARRKRIAPSGQVPQIFDLTVSQLRQELRAFQQQREQQAAGHAAARQAQSQITAANLAQQQARQSRQQRAAAQGRAPIATSPQQPPRQKPFQDVRSPYSPYAPVTGESWSRFEVMRGIYGF